MNDEKRRRRRSRELSAPQELLLCIFKCYACWSLAISSATERTCSSALLLPVYRFYHSILSLFHSWRKILLVYCYGNNTLYQFSKCFCCSSACVRFFPSFKYYADVFVAHTHEWSGAVRSEHFQQSQNFHIRIRIQVKDTQSMKSWNVFRQNMLHICNIRAFVCDCNVIQSTNADNSTGEGVWQFDGEVLLACICDERRVWSRKNNFKHTMKFAHWKANVRSVDFIVRCVVLDFILTICFVSITIPQS